MLKQTCRVLLAACATTFCVSASFAHHGWTSYDEATELTVTGTVTESDYRNPHATIRIEGDGKIWVAWLAPLRRMEARGLNKDLVAVGTTVTVVGYPSTVTDDELRAERIIIDGTATELR